MDAQSLHRIGKPADAVIKAAVQLVVSVHRRQGALGIRQDSRRNIFKRKFDRR